MNGRKSLTSVALDSNIFIYHFENHPEFASFTEEIFKNLADNAWKAVTSIISLIETLSYPLSPELTEVVKQQFKTVPNLTIFDVNETLALEAARLRREYKIRLPDSVQLATALYAKADAFITNDYRLQSFKELKIIMLSDFNL